MAVSDDKSTLKEPLKSLKTSGSPTWHPRPTRIGGGGLEKRLKFIVAVNRNSSAVHDFDPYN